PCGRAGTDSTARSGTARLGTARFGTAPDLPRHSSDNRPEPDLWTIPIGHSGLWKPAGANQLSRAERRHRPCVDAVAEDATVCWQVGVTGRCGDVPIDGPA